MLDTMALPDELSRCLLEKGSAIRIVLSNRAYLDRMVPDLVKELPPTRDTHILALPPENKLALLDRLMFGSLFLMKIRQMNLKDGLDPEYQGFELLSDLLTVTYKKDMLRVYLSSAKAPFVEKLLEGFNP